MQKQDYAAFGLCPRVQQGTRDLEGTRMNTSLSFIMNQRLLLIPANAQTPWLIAWTLELNAGGVLPTGWKSTWSIHEGFLNTAGTTGPVDSFRTQPSLGTLS